MLDTPQPPQRIARLVRVLQLLQSGRSLNSREIAEHCQVSRRQVFRDLNTLQRAGLDLHFDRSHQCYQLLSPTRIPLSSVDSSDLEALLGIGLNLGRPDSIVPLLGPASVAAEGLWEQQRQARGGELRQEPPALEIRASRAIQATSMQEHFERLQRSIRERLKIRIRSRLAVAGREITTLLSPYRLLCLEGDWFAIGRSSLHRMPRIFPLARIIRSELTSDSYQLPARFSLEKLLGSPWRLLRETGPSVQIVIRFSAAVSERVAGAVWHRSQTLRWNPDGSLDFRVRVDGWREILRWIIGFGKQAEVLEPDQLRAAVQEQR